MVVPYFRTTPYNRSLCICGAELSPTSPMVSEDEESGYVDAECACGCQLVQPVGQIILAANHSCFRSTRPVVWHIYADRGRVVQLTYRLLARDHQHDDTFDPARSVNQSINQSISLFGDREQLVKIKYTSLSPVVKAEIQRWGNCEFRFWSPVSGRGPRDY